jgi:hypothetical protein
MRAPTILRDLYSVHIADVAWRDDMIRDLINALKFYAAESNYQQRGWQGDPDKSLVDSDNGRRARIALIKARDAMEEKR